MKVSTLVVGAAMLAAPTFAEPALAGDAGPVAAAATKVFTLTKLVGDKAGAASITDPNLVNPWGIAALSGGAPWIANNGTGTSEIVEGNSGTLGSPVFLIPSPSGGVGAPTGVVAYAGTAFLVSSNGMSGSSNFIFDTEDGTILGWSPAASSSSAVIAFDGSAQNDVFKGLALATVGKASELFATDFHNAQVVIFDDKFKKIGSFTDKSAPAGYAPFNIASIGGNLYVTFAKQDAAKHDNLDGAGAGLIDVFTTSGKLVRRLVTGGKLNAPWGLAIAPKTFGSLAGALLVGNFGDGRINAYNATTGAFVGQMIGTNGKALVIDGLWAITVNSAGTLTFTAGTNHENDGLLGTIAPSAAAVAVR